MSYRPNWPEGQNQPLETPYPQPWAEGQNQPQIVYVPAPPIIQPAQKSSLTRVYGILLIGGAVLLGLSILSFFVAAVLAGISSPAQVQLWSAVGAAILLLGAPLGVLGILVGIALLVVGAIWARQRA